MNWKNIWQHPKTSAAGVLISVATVAGVLSQNGVSLGSAGTGTVVSLAGALATALLGLLAKDPGVSTPAASPATNTTAKLSAWLLIALLIPLPWMQGCNATNVAQDIVNWTPSLQSAVATVDSMAALLAPADAPAFTAATVGFDAASNLLVAQAKAYLANPSPSVLAQLQSQVVTLQQQVSTALLQAARITNTASQQHAMAAINAVATIVTAILALVSQVSSKAAVAQMAAASTVKLAQIEPYMDRNAAAIAVAEHYGVSSQAGAESAQMAANNLEQAGF